MKCINCEREFENGLEQCPHCGCHYPEKVSRVKPKTPDEIDKTPEAKQVKSLIDAAVVKGYVTDKERKVILKTAKANNLDSEVTEIMLDSAVEKAKKVLSLEERSINSEESASDNPSPIDKSIRYCRYCGTQLSFGAICCRKCGRGVERKY